MVCESERPGVESSIAGQIQDVVNFIAVYRTRLPCDLVISVDDI